MESEEKLSSSPEDPVVEWTPSNLNLSAQGQLVAEARAEGFIWSPSYLNLEENESCACFPGSPEVESPDAYGSPQDLEMTLACLKEAVAIKGDILGLTPLPAQGQGQDYATYTVTVTCHCEGPDDGKDETGQKLGPTLPVDDPEKSRGGPVDVGQVVEAPLGKGVAALEDVFVWEAKSYVGSDDSNKEEELRKAGKSPYPLGPGERSDYELGIAPTQSRQMQMQEEKPRTAEESPTPKKVCPCAAGRQDLLNEKGDALLSPQGEVEVRAGQIIDAPLGKEVAAMEDVFVWEAKSYAGSEDSNKQEDLRRAGKAPIPPGPGERSEEELGIRKERLPEETVGIQSPGGVGDVPGRKKKCPCPKRSKVPIDGVEGKTFSPSVEVGHVIEAPLGKQVAATEDIYVWEAKSYAGTEDSNKQEEMRKAGTVAYPLGPGERSDDELGILPAPKEHEVSPEEREVVVGDKSAPKEPCSCSGARKSEEQSPEEIGDTPGQPSVEMGHVIEAPLGKAVAAIEDVFVWEAKSYAGTEDSNQQEELRRAGKAPYPLGPGERSDEELGIAPVARQQLPIRDGDTQYVSGGPLPKKCCCVKQHEGECEIVDDGLVQQGPLEVGQIIDAPLGKAVAATEDIYVWEAKSYAGTEDSNKEEEMRRAGKAPYPLGPGERSDEELGIVPIAREKPALTEDNQHVPSGPSGKKTCSCTQMQKSDAKPEDISSQEHAVESVQIIEAPLGRAVAATEDIYVWEAKSYAGTEDSNREEELRRAGKAPYPLGPGERSDEELGIAPVSQRIREDVPHVQSGPTQKKPCSCAKPHKGECKDVGSERSQLPPVESGQIVEAPLGKGVAALEDVFVWEAKSYAGTEDSNQEEELRRAGKAPYPLGPGERSEEELGILPARKEITPQQTERPVSKRKCYCTVPFPDKTGENAGQVSQQPSVEVGQVIEAPLGHAVAATEDIYVWEAKSYAGSEDSNREEELRKAGKIPYPRGPGERSEEELGIAPVSRTQPAQINEQVSLKSDSKAQSEKQKTCSCGKTGVSEKAIVAEDNLVQVGQTVEAPLGRQVAALEDVFVWEARSYAGSEDSDKQEELRKTGNAQIPLGPGERSEEELGIIPVRTVQTPQAVQESHVPRDTPKIKCHCCVNEKPAGEGTSPEVGGVIEAPHGKAVTNLEDVFVWEAKSYEGSQDSNQQEKLRKEGKAPYPLGPGERSDEELGIVSQRTEGGRPQPIDSSSSKKCPCGGRLKGGCGRLHCEGDVSAVDDDVGDRTVCQGPCGESLVQRSICPCKAKRNGTPPPQQELPREAKRKCHCPSSSEMDAHAAPGSCVCRHCKKKRDHVAIQMGGANPMPQWDYQLSYGLDKCIGPSVLDVYRLEQTDAGSVDTILGPQFPGDVTSQSGTGIRDTGMRSAETTSKLPWGNFCVASRKPPDLSFPSYAETAANADIQWEKNSCSCKPSVTERIEFLTHILQEGISPLRDSLRELQLKVRELGIPEFAELEKDVIGETFGDTCLCCPYSSPCGHGHINRRLDGSFITPMPCPCVGIYIVSNNGMTETGAGGLSDVPFSPCAICSEATGNTCGPAKTTIPLKPVCTVCTHNYIAGTPQAGRIDDDLSVQQSETDPCGDRETDICRPCCSNYMS